MTISGSHLICNNTADNLHSNLFVSSKFNVNNVKYAAIGIADCQKIEVFAKCDGSNEDCKNCFFVDNLPFKKIDFNEKNELFFSPDEIDTYYKLRVSYENNPEWEIDSFKGERMLGTSQSLTITVSPKDNLPDPPSDRKPVVKIYSYDDFIAGKKNPIYAVFEEDGKGKYVYTIEKLSADTAFEIVIE